MCSHAYRNLIMSAIYHLFRFYTYLLLFHYFSFKYGINIVFPFLSHSLLHISQLLHSPLFAYSCNLCYFNTYKSFLVFRFFCLIFSLMSLPHLFFFIVVTSFPFIDLVQLLGHTKVHC